MSRLQDRIARLHQMIEATTNFIIRLEQRKVRLHQELRMKEEKLKALPAQPI